MKTIRTFFAETSWAIALVALLAAGTGCEAAKDGEGGGLLGKVGSSLGDFRKSDGKVSIADASERKEREAPEGGGSLFDGGDDPSGDAGDETPPAAGTPCRSACERIVNCMLESCPALGSPDVEDVAAVVDDCAAECDGAVSADQASAIQSMACGEIWAEMTAAEPGLDEACGGGSFEDDSFDDEGYGDDGYYDDEGYGYDDGEYGDEYGYEDEYGMGMEGYEDRGDEGYGSDDEGYEDYEDYEDCDV